jgi:hypothetical protein
MQQRMIERLFGLGGAKNRQWLFSNRAKTKFAHKILKWMPNGTVVWVKWVYEDSPHHDMRLLITICMRFLITIFKTSYYVFIEFRSEFYITILEISLCMYFEIFSYENYCMYVLITISRYFFG